jgi:hypothetical protein
MRCPDCDGTGQGGGRDLVNACETCNGEGFVDGGWADDDERDRIYEENLYLYGGRLP